MGCGCSAPRVSNPHTPSRKGENPGNAALRLRVLRGLADAWFVDVLKFGFRMTRAAVLHFVICVGVSGAGLKSFQQLGCGFRLSNKKLKRPSYRSAGTNEKSNVMSVLEVLMVAKDVIDQDFKGIPGAVGSPFSVGQFNSI